MKISKPFLQRAGTLAISLLIPIAAIFVALGIGALLIAIQGINPFEAYAVLLEAPFGSVLGLTEIVVRASPILLIGLGVAIGFRANIWNVGGEGQFYAGAVAATVVGVVLQGASPIPMLLTMGLAAIIAGILWAGIPGILKISRNVNEIVGTLMMNYIAILITTYLLRGTALHDPSSALVRSLPIAPAGALSVIVPHTRFHLGVFVALTAVPLISILLWKMVIGYRLRAIGINPRAAMVLGLEVNRTTLLAFVYGGALAGLAGMLEISGVYQRLMIGISGGAGFNGVVVALLGGLHPVGVLLAALLFSALSIGADAMQRVLGVSVGLVYMIQALVVIFMLLGQSLRWRRT